MRELLITGNVSLTPKQNCDTRQLMLFCAVKRRIPYVAAGYGITNVVGHCVSCGSVRQPCRGQSAMKQDTVRRTVYL